MLHTFHHNISINNASPIGTSLIERLCAAYIISYRNIFINKIKLDMANASMCIPATCLFVKVLVRSIQPSSAQLSAAQLFKYRRRIPINIYSPAVGTMQGKTTLTHTKRWSILMLLLRCCRRWSYHSSQADTQAGSLYVYGPTAPASQRHANKHHLDRGS